MKILRNFLVIGSLGLAACTGTPSNEPMLTSKDGRTTVPGILAAAVFKTHCIDNSSGRKLRNDKNYTTEVNNVEGFDGVRAVSAKHKTLAIKFVIFNGEIDRCTATFVGPKSAAEDAAMALALLHTTLSGGEVVGRRGSGSAGFKTSKGLVKGQNCSNCEKNAYSLSLIP